MVMVACGCGCGCGRGVAVVSAAVVAVAAPVAALGVLVLVGVLLSMLNQGANQSMMKAKPSAENSRRWIGQSKLRMNQTSTDLRGRCAKAKKLLISISRVSAMKTMMRNDAD